MYCAWCSLWLEDAIWGLMVYQFFRGMTVFIPNEVAVWTKVVSLGINWIDLPFRPSVVVNLY